MKHIVSVGAAALAYNYPMFFSHGKTVTRPLTLEKFNDELNTEYGELRGIGIIVTKLYIGRTIIHDGSRPGEVDWSADFTYEGSKELAEKIATTIGCMLWGQYAYGDAGEPEYLEFEDITEELGAACGTAIHGLVECMGD